MNQKKMSEFGQILELSNFIDQVFVNPDEEEVFILRTAGQSNLAKEGHDLTNSFFKTNPNLRPKNVSVEEIVDVSDT